MKYYNSRAQGAFGVHDYLLDDWSELMYLLVGPGHDSDYWKYLDDEEREELIADWVEACRKSGGPVPIVNDRVRKYGRWDKFEDATVEQKIEGAKQEGKLDGIKFAMLMCSKAAEAFNKRPY